MSQLAAGVPDTLSGAVTLSLIDFFLSIVIIVGISLTLYLLPALDKIVTAWTGAGSGSGMSGRVRALRTRRLDRARPASSVLRRSGEQLPGRGDGHGGEQMTVEEHAFVLVPAVPDGGDDERAEVLSDRRDDGTARPGLFRGHDLA